MFNNARTYNQEGSWVYVDADEMEKVFNTTFDRAIAGTDLPGAPPSVVASTSNDVVMSPAEDHKPLPKGKHSRKQVRSDDEEYLTPSDEE